MVSVGIVLNVRSLQVYLRMPKSHRSKVSDFLACLTLVPLVAFVASLASFSIWTTSDLIAVNLLAFGVGWLVFSGTTQTLYWYWRSWESRADG